MEAYKITILYLFVLTAFIFFPTANSFGNEYEALKGVQSVRAVFDMRVGDPWVAAAQLELIHKTFKDPNLTIGPMKPDLVVIFMGRAVELVSRTREGFTPEEQKQMDAIARIISNMAKDGIKLEICMYAVHSANVDPDSILPEIKPVGNGWISSIGYQLNGYALISNL